MPAKGVQMMIEGLPVRELTKPIRLIISEEDCARGVRGQKANRGKAPGMCAAALAAKRLPEITEARIHIGRIFLKFKNKYWLRGKTPAALRTEIVSFDRGGHFEPGEYMIRPLSPSERPTGAGMGGDKNKNITATKRRNTDKRLKPKILRDVRHNAHAEYTFKRKAAK